MANPGTSKKNTLKTRNYGIRKGFIFELTLKMFYLKKTID